MDLRLITHEMMTAGDFLNVPNNNNMHSSILNMALCNGVLFFSSLWSFYESLVSQTITEVMQVVDTEACSL